MILFLYLLFSLVNSEKIIKNINIPSCKNCIHFQPSIYNKDFTSSLNRCIKFGNKNIISDEISYDFADLCRNDELKCGYEGKYFEEEKNINLKILKHSLLTNLPNFFIITLFSFIIISQIYLTKSN